MKNILITFLLLCSFFAHAQSWSPKNGSNNPNNHYTAFINANIFVDSATFISNGTLLIKNERIEKVGKVVSIPANTLIIDLKGKFVYPAFIELHSQFGISDWTVESSKGGGPQLESNKSKSYYWNETVKPETDASALLTFDEKAAEKFRKMGFGTVLTHQMDGIIRGTSALVNLSESGKNQIVKPKVAMHYSFYKGKSKQTYPSSLMGMIALIRQAQYDAAWYANNETDYNKSLAALTKAKSLPKMIDAGSTLSELRADKIGDEFNFQFIIKGNGKEFQRIKEVKATNASLIVPINFPKPYDVADPFEALQISLSKLKDWELAPKNLAMLAAQKMNFSITTDGLEKEKDFFENMQQAIENGLNRATAVHSLTQTPAQLIGVDSILGTLSAKKLANFIVLSDTIFTKKGKLISTWVSGKEFSIDAENAVNYAGLYSLNINKKLQFDLKVKRDKGAFKAEVSEKGADKFKAAKIKMEGNRVNLSFQIDETSYRLSGSANDTMSRIWSGKAIINQEWVEWAAIKKGELPDTVSSAEDAAKLTFPPIFYPNMAFGWDTIPEKAENVVFRNATLWTNEKEGILKNHDLFIADGKVKMVGYKINMEVMFPEFANNFTEVDASDLHITSGIIDEHSHIAIDRGVNESGQAVTSEVSIGDVVRSNDINIYRQLSGGVTASQLLHGSANPIGGQSAMIKLRWGKVPEEMKLDSTKFIKFALGENVKQSNWGDQRKVRFPQTRMGVEQVFYDAFTRAREYQAEWTIYNAKKKKDKKKETAPRRDLELEALVEILDSNRFITCHSYIQSEINMLMHVADSMDFNINTFTHILEGYKVADKLKAHGAAASTFSDWWAYKFEVNDAIPFNGAILHNQGVLTGFNSDDAEMGRRLNQEAAKAVKYGGVSEEEAWKFVTLNPAKMLHLDHRMGSLKAGKDADVVVWTNHPMSIYAKVKQTYIDGIPYYDQNRDEKLRQRVTTERERIIDLMLAEKGKGKETQKITKEEEKLYECDTYGE